MITVSILINGQPIYTRSARRKIGAPGEICIYECDNGSTITHDYDAGAVSLAHKMLDTIKELSKKERQEKKLEELFNLFNSRKERQ